MSNIKVYAGKRTTAIMCSLQLSPSNNDQSDVESSILLDRAFLHVESKHYLFLINWYLKCICILRYWYINDVY